LKDFDFFGLENLYLCLLSASPILKCNFPHFQFDHPYFLPHHCLDFLIPLPFIEFPFLPNSLKINPYYPVQNSHLKLPCYLNLSQFPLSLHHAYPAHLINHHSLTTQ